MVDPVAAQFAHISSDFDFRYDQPRNRARSNARSGFTRARAPAAAIIANAVFRIVDIVRMPGAIALRDL